MSRLEDTRSSSEQGTGAAGFASATLFAVIELEAPLRTPSRHRLADLDEVTIGRGDGRAWDRRVGAGKGALGLEVADSHMSRRHARLLRGDDGWILEDAGSKNGTLLNGARVRRAALADGDLLEVGRTLFLYRAPAPVEADEPADALASDLGHLAPEVASLSDRLRRDLARLALVIRSATPIVLFGETGTGKGVLTRAIHRLSGRAGALVPVNCGALPDTLLEAELFGSRRGSYSGSIEDRPGHLRSADGGTLLLDEIGDLPHASQAVFLRALQDREVVPVGSHRPVSVDFRLVAATHRDLAAMTAAGAFREDLYARLGGFWLTLPPLRDRREDIGLLLAAILAREVPDRAEAVRLSPEAARVLITHRWPLNVRELERCITTAVLLARDGTVRVEHLPPTIRSALGPAPAVDDGSLSPEDRRLRDELVALMREHRGNVSAVARSMGRQRVQIHRWLRRLGIDRHAFAG